jgi:hypothetical protein
MIYTQNYVMWIPPSFDYKIIFWICQFKNPKVPEPKFQESNRQIEIKAKEKDSQTNRQTDTHTNRQTDINTDIKYTV